MVGSIVRGEKSVSAENVDNLINGIIDEDVSISGYKLKNIAEDAESYVEKIIKPNLKKVLRISLLMLFMTKHLNKVCLLLIKTLG